MFEVIAWNATQRNHPLRIGHFPPIMITYASLRDCSDAHARDPLALLQVMDAQLQASRPNWTPAECSLTYVFTGSDSKRGVSWQHGMIDRMASRLLDINGASPRWYVVNDVGIAVHA